MKAKECNRRGTWPWREDSWWHRYGAKHRRRLVRSASLAEADEEMHDLDADLEDEALMIAEQDELDAARRRENAS